MKTRNVIKSPWYQKNWGHRVKLVEDQDTKHKFENTERGYRMATSVTGGITGEGGDCFPAGTMIATKDGYIDIAVLHTLESPPEVLTWNFAEARYEYRRITASRRKRSSKPLVRLTTTQGRAVVCTEDHQVYTTDGFRAASVVERGEALRVCGSDVRPVPESVYAQAVRDCQGTYSQGAGVLLLNEMQERLAQLVAQDMEVPEVRRSGVSSKVILHGRVRVGDSSGETKNVPLDMRVLPNHIQEPSVKVAVLRKDMRKRQSCDSNDRQWQLKVQNRNVAIEDVAGGVEAGMFGQRRVCLCGVWSGRAELQDGGWPSQEQSYRAPYRREQEELLPYEFNHPLLHASRNPSQVKADTISMAQRICDQSHEVYDLQVEGNHNFFANGILVHNCLVLDDPHNALQANSEVERIKVKEFVDRAWSSRVNNPKKVVKAVIMQRLHEDDVTAHLLAKEAGWMHLMLPTEYIPVTRVWFNGKADPRKAEGQLLWPERFGQVEVDSAKLDLGDYGFASQHQQTPTSRTAGMFNVVKLRQSIVQHRPACCVRARGWDLAATTKKDSKRTAGVLMSKDQHGAYYVEHVTLGKWTPDIRNETMKARTIADGHNVMVKVEHEGGSSGEDQALSIIRLLNGYDVEFVKVSGDKATRADSFAAQCNAGNVHIVDDGTWDVEAYLAELGSFPEGSFKDQVDGATVVYNKISPMEVVEYKSEEGVRPPVPTGVESWMDKLPGAGWQNDLRSIGR